MRYVSKSILKKVYKKRSPWCHKGQFGRLFCIVGNEWNTGSPIFVGMAAYRAGCDLVFLTGPERAMDVTANYSPLLITRPLEGEQLEIKHIPKILDFMEKIKPKAVVIGNGLWRKEETRKSIVELIEKINLPLVIDADAIRAISTAKEKLYMKNCILLPHADEFHELTGIKVTTDVKQRIKVVKNEVYKINCGSSLNKICPIVPPATVVLKGHVDVISNGKEVVLNKTGSPFMSVGGCGDTLAGISGALLARGIDTFIAAQTAAYINGRAGELAAKDYGEGMTPLDLIEKIPKVIKNG
ncbi:MAG: NAD(P)H-hydrate dehydratase [Candidatus Aenigmarchaeota archaeon]|nr:NAD(P)H-hydrate dehydratase [Candidatus Aenigmarchaeota archaeon]